MIVNIEPKDWNMHSVKMFFNRDEPETEDAAIRRYLEDNRLEPRRRYDTDLNGETFEVMTFGGCYLGRHSGALAEIQRRELLMEALPALLSEGPDADARAQAAAMSGERMREIVAALADALCPSVNFAISKDGELQADLDAADVQARFLALAAADGKALAHQPLSTT